MQSYPTSLNWRTIAVIVVVLAAAAGMVALRPWLADAGPGGGESLEHPGSPVLRLHVIANSDQDDDQRVKLMVRDAVVDYLQRAVSVLAAKTVDEALAAAENHHEALEQVIRELLERLGSPYDVRVEIGRFVYDGRYYKDVWVPPGRYPSIQVVLGEGRGANWWCVLFAPLCAVPPAAVADGNPSQTSEKSEFVGGEPAAATAATDYVLVVDGAGELHVVRASDVDGLAGPGRAAQVQIRSALWQWVGRLWEAPVLTARGADSNR